MTADLKFEDGVASGANELGARIAIVAQWGVPLTVEVVDAMKQAMIDHAPGAVRDIMNPYPELEDRAADGPLSDYYEESQKEVHP